MKRYPLVAYFLLALALSWSIGVPLAFARVGGWKVNLPYGLHYLTAYGPMLAALIVLGVTEGRRGIGAFLRRGFRLDIGWGWLAVALLSPIALYAVGVITAAIAGRHVPGLRALGQINFLPNLGLGAWLFWMLTSGLGEEIGWRGYALPRLQRRRTMSTIAAKAEVFLAQPRIAVAGVSRTRQDAANLIYRRLRARGYHVFPVNPKAETVDGDRCYPDLASIPGGVTGVVIVTRPQLTEEIVRQCPAAGVGQVWMHRSLVHGGSSVSEHAVAFCEAHGISAIAGGCPLMFGRTADVGHRCMRWVMHLLGRLPA